MRRSKSGSWTVVLLLGWGPTAANGAQKSEAPPAPTQIAQWIQQLDDSRFSVRESATSNLHKSGQAKGDIHCATKLGRGGSDVLSSTETFRWNPAGDQSRLVELGEQPEASLAWGGVIRTAKRRQRVNSKRGHPRLVAKKCQRTLFRL
jgi:hypothetical protein